VARSLIFLLSALALAPAPAAQAGGPSLRVGAATDMVKQATLPAAKAQLQLLRLAGLDTVRITAVWSPGQTAPAAAEAARIKNVADAANIVGIKVIVAVYRATSATTPLTEEARADFAAFATAIVRQNRSIRDVIVGNEPNLNRFWLPQFDETGASVAPAAYLQLLAETFDALKAVSPVITVWGGSLSPRGTDRPFGIRPSHSPTTFIQGLGAAYRASGRTVRVMDGLAVHPYGDNSSQAPSKSAHPNTTSIGLGDYAKLVSLIGQAFDGTAQPGWALPILYDEYGVETVIPEAKASLYAGTEAEATRPVDEATQGAYYREAIAMTFCQPNVRGLLLFHGLDETDLGRWQSGVYYADGKPKTSLPTVRSAAGESRRAIVAACPGLALTPKLVKAQWPTPGKASTPVKVRLSCSIDCTGAIFIESVPGGRPVATRALDLVGGEFRRTSLGRLAPGRYRLRLSVTATVNPGPPLERRSPPFRLR
jgi:hypothetical protein